MQNIDNRTTLDIPGRTLRGPELTICVLSRHDIERTVIAQPHLLISIECPNIPDPLIRPNPQRIAFLPLRFHDYGYGERNNCSESELMINGHPPIFFSEEHAQQIAEFVSKNKESTRLLLCQCNGGLSRSPAIARALHEHFNAPLKTQEHEMPPGNRLIFDIMALILMRDTGVDLARHSLVNDIRPLSGSAPGNPTLPI